MIVLDHDFEALTHFFEGGSKVAGDLGSGLPCGCHSRPGFLKSPAGSFFLVSTEITGSPCFR